MSLIVFVFVFLFVCCCFVVVVVIFTLIVEWECMDKYMLLYFRNIYINWIIKTFFLIKTCRKETECSAHWRRSNTSVAVPSSLGPLSLSLSQEVSKQQGRIFGALDSTPKSPDIAHEMPVAGLPTALDYSSLEALLKDNAVSSWTVSAEEKITSVELPLVSTADPDMADFAHPSTQTQHLRRKPTS